LGQNNKKMTTPHFTPKTVFREQNYENRRDIPETRSLAGKCPHFDTNR
jgi:hypothetical protein